MALINVTNDNGSATHTSANGVYGLLQTLAVQDIVNAETGELLPDVFGVTEVGNGQYLQTIRLKMAKDAVGYDKTKFFNAVTLNKPEFLQEFHETWKKYQYNIGYNRKDLADQLASGKSEEEIKAEAVSNLSKKHALDEVSLIEKCIYDVTNKIAITHSNLSTFKTISASETDLKVVVQNIRSIINYLARFNSLGSKLNMESGMSRDDIVVCMSESCQNILDTYLKTGIYNLQYLYDNYNVVTLPDADFLKLYPTAPRLDRIYIMDKRHIVHAKRDEVVESQYDAPSQTFGVFYTLDEMYGTSGLFKAVYFDAGNPVTQYLA